MEDQKNRPAITLVTRAVQAGNRVVYITQEEADQSGGGSGSGDQESRSPG